MFCLHKIGGIVVATKSILKSVIIKDKATSTSLINALENAKNKKAIDVTLSRTVRNADSELIKKIFGDTK